MNIKKELDGMVDRFLFEISVIAIVVLCLILAIQMYTLKELSTLQMYNPTLKLVSEKFKCKYFGEKYKGYCRWEMKSNGNN